MRFLFYSHDGFGLGHTCRNIAIARALTDLAPRASVLLATGSDDVTRLGVQDRVEVLKLPGLRKLANESYASRYMDVPPEDVRHLRSRLLLSALESFRPDVLLVDKHPFGAGGELKDALAAIRKLGGKAVLGLRDILDDPETVRAEWTPHNLPAAIPAHYDSVLVYGQEKIFNTAAAYDFPSALRKRTHYSGYVTNPVVGQASCLSTQGVSPEFQTSNPTRTSGETPSVQTGRMPVPLNPLVIATVGGGEDGFHLLRNFLHASIGAPWRAVAVTGPMMGGGEHSELEKLAQTHGIALHTFVPGLNHWYTAASAVVCMGGYNTITQTLAVGALVICVPRVHPRREQLVRAEAFAQLGLLRYVLPGELSPARLRAEVECAIASSRPELRQRIKATVEFDGAEFAAHHLLAIARAAIRNASLLLFDEPTTGLDEANERIVIEGLKNLSRGRTALWVTHNPRHAEIADVVLRIDNGKGELLPASVGVNTSNEVQHV